LICGRNPSGLFCPFAALIARGPFEGLGAKLPVRVPSHRQTGKESHPVAGFYTMKTGKALPDPTGDRSIFSLSDGGESLPRLRKARPDFWPSFRRNEPDSYRSLHGFAPYQPGKLLEKRVFGQFGILRKIFAPCGTAT